MKFLHQALTNEPTKSLKLYLAKSRYCGHFLISIPEHLNLKFPVYRKNPIISLPFTEP